MFILSVSEGPVLYIVALLTQGVGMRRRVYLLSPFEGVRVKIQIRSSAWLEHYTDNVGVSSSNLLGSTGKVRSRKVGKSERFSFGLTVLRSSGLKAGGLAQLARALALQAKGHRFDSDILHLRSINY